MNPRRTEVVEHVAVLRRAVAFVAAKPYCGYSRSRPTMISIALYLGKNRRGADATFAMRRRR